MERIPADTWHTYAGHIERYEWAAQWCADHLDPGQTVNDVACGVGYGAQVLRNRAALTDLKYRGYDKPGVPDPSFPGGFVGCDLDAEGWLPEAAAATFCFETLEHVQDPTVLAYKLARTTHRAIFVSVPVVPTVHQWGWHLHDFTEDDIPPLFPRFHVAEDWAQPRELSHVWRLERTA